MLIIADCDSVDVDENHTGGFSVGVDGYAGRIFRFVGTLLIVDVSFFSYSQPVHGCGLESAADIFSRVGTALLHHCDR